MESDLLLAVMHQHQTAMAQLVTAAQQVYDSLLSTQQVSDVLLTSQTMHDALQMYMDALCQPLLDAQRVVDYLRQAIMQWPQGPTR
jgi:hypothetical protein